MRWIVASLLLALTLNGSEVLFAQAFVEQVSPLVLQRGVTTRIEILGNDTADAVGLWSSLPTNVFRARPVAASGSKTATFDVELTAQAPLGLYGLRLATRSGLSNVHLFLVDELPVSRSSFGEPAGVSPRTGNDTRDVRGLTPPGSPAVMRVKLPACLTASCRPAAIDRYSIVVDKGQRVAFEVVGNRLGKDYDPLVCVRNSTGKIVAECDNSVGLFFDCRFAHTFAESGNYTVEVRDSRYEGHPTWHYVLRMGDFPEARVSIPSTVVAGETTSLTFPQIVGWQLPVAFPREQATDSFFHEIRRTPNSVATWIPFAISDLPPVIEVEPNDTI